MTCSGGHRLISRDDLLRSVGVCQCLDCSWVFQAVAFVPRACSHCGLEYGESLHDPCLGTLEDVVEACCGHGDESRRYVTYAEGRREGAAPDDSVAKVAV